MLTAAGCLFILEPDGHIDMLYVHPDVARRGIGSALLLWVEEAARASDLRRLYTEASITAGAVFAVRLPYNDLWSASDLSVTTCFGGREGFEPNCILLTLLTILAATIFDTTTNTRTAETQWLNAQRRVAASHTVGSRPHDPLF
ncbi:MAG: GNAT family N-acetyltransferase, partial [Terriglobales bacterium]